MARRFFDIMPPYPKEVRHHTNKAKKEKIKSQKTFIIFIFGLFLIFIIFTFTKYENLTNQSGTSTPTSSSTSKNTTNNQFELFNDQGQSSLLGQANLITIRLFNGASSTDNVNIAKDLLLKAGFQIEKTDQAANDYEQTIIYYKKDRQSLAKKAADALKPNFSAQVQESTNLDASYDLLIIVGQK